MLCLGADIMCHVTCSPLRLVTSCWAASSSFLSFSTVSGPELSRDFGPSPRLLVDLVLVRPRFILFICPGLGSGCLLLDLGREVKEELEVDLVIAPGLVRFEMEPETDLARFERDALRLMSRLTEELAVSVLFLRLDSWRSELRLCI